MLSILAAAALYLSACVLADANATPVVERGLLSSESKSSTTFSTVTTTTTGTAVPGESALPACGILCFDNMLAQYSTLGCNQFDATCLCNNVNFGYGIRDCSNGACGTAVASTVIAFGSAYCSTASATHTGSGVSTTTGTAVPGESNLPACGQSCFNNMLAQYSTLGCAPLDSYCLCNNVNFGYGIRDCSNGACGTDVASTVIAFGSAYCSSATASTSSSSTLSTKLSTTSASRSQSLTLTSSPTTVSTRLSTTSTSVSQTATSTSSSTRVSASVSTSGTPTQSPWTSIETDPASYNMVMTTTYTQSPQCTGASITQMAWHGANLWENAINPVAISTITTCYPSQFYSSVMGAIHSVDLPAFSALVCPDTWETTNYNDTYIVCCPSGFGINAPYYTSNSDRPFSGAACTSNLGPGQLYDITSYDSTAYLTVVPTSAPTDGTIIRVNAFDGIAANVPTQTSISSSTSI